MTITEHFWHRDQNTGGVSVDEVREYTAQLWIRSDDVNDNGKTVIDYLIAEGFDLDATYDVGNDSDPDAYLYQIDPPQRLSGSCELWTALLHYRYYEGGSNPNDPASARPDMSMGVAARTEAFDSGIYRGGFDGRLTELHTVGNHAILANSAGTPYGAREMTRFNRTIRITRNRIAVTVNDFSYPVDFINSSPVSISVRQIAFYAPAYTLKFRGWNMSQQTLTSGSATLDYVAIDCELEYNPRGWRLPLASSGPEMRGLPGDISVRTKTPLPANAATGRQTIPSGEGGGITDHALDASGAPVLLRDYRTGGGAGVLAYGVWSPDGQQEIDIRTLPHFQGISA